MKVILASSSPRRREILGRTALKFDIVPSEYEEDNSLAMPPGELVEHLALGKAQWVARRHPEALVIASDTLVAFEGRVLGKPKDAANAKAQLKELSGKTNSVWTGLAIVAPKRTRSLAVESKITFRLISDDEIERYVATGEPLDKAGSYAVQGLGALFIDHMEGDFYSVMGLPLNRLSTQLREFGVELLP